MPLRDLPGNHADDLENWIGDLVARHRGTLRSDRRTLLDRFSVVDVAHRVVGVGSVGTRAWVFLLSDSLGQPLVLQAKEAAAAGRLPSTPGV